MTRFVSSRLDPTRLRSLRPTIFNELDHSANLANRMAKFKELWPEYDVGALEPDPARMLQQVDAYREILDLELVNNGYRALLAAFSSGVDLDHIALRAGILRLEITPATDTQPAVMEDDETFRMRYFASFSSPAAGSADGYIFDALTAVPLLRDVVVYDFQTSGATIPEGTVHVVPLAPNGRALTSTEISKITSAVTAKHRRQIGCQLEVLPATVHNYSVSLTMWVRPGPDLAAVKTSVEQETAKILAERFIIGGEVHLADIARAAYAAGALQVTVSSPSQNILSAPYRAPFCTGVTVTVLER